MAGEDPGRLEVMGAGNLAESAPSRWATPPETGTRPGRAVYMTGSTADATIVRLETIRPNPFQETS